jgi:hypothetical protein
LLWFYHSRLACIHTGPCSGGMFLDMNTSRRGCIFGALEALPHCSESASHALARLQYSTMTSLLSLRVAALWIGKDCDRPSQKQPAFTNLLDRKHADSLIVSTILRCEFTQSCVRVRASTDPRFASALCARPAPHLVGDHQAGALSQSHDGSMFKRHGLFVENKNMLDWAGNEHVGHRSTSALPVGNILMDSRLRAISRDLPTRILPI